MFKEKLLTLLSANKAPFALGCVGLLLILTGIIWVFSQNSDEKGVLIEGAASTEKAQASQSAYTKEIVVDIGGGVLAPGVYRLPEGARVQEALIAAGGLSQNANREYIAKNINLAQKLSDGVKIYLPLIGEKADVGQSLVVSTGGKAAGGMTGLVNINQASLSDLDRLPGIGPVTGQKIIDGRPYAKIEDLLSKKIVGQKVFEQIKEKITLN